MKRLLGAGWLIFLVVTIAMGAQNAQKRSGSTPDSAPDRSSPEVERADIKRERDNLKSFQMELEQRAAALEALKKELDEREKQLKQRLTNESVNKQTVESYQSIDPEQSAVLLLSLFKEDENLTALLLRKMEAKKAGKIFEAMVPLDPGATTRLTHLVLTFYDDKKK